MVQGLQCAAVRCEVVEQKGEVQPFAKPAQPAAVGNQAKDVLGRSNPAQSARDTDGRTYEGGRVASCEGSRPKAEPAGQFGDVSWLRIADGFREGEGELPSSGVINCPIPRDYTAAS